VCGSPDKKLCELSRFQFRDGKQQENGESDGRRRWKWKTASESSEEKGREGEVKFFLDGESEKMEIVWKR